MLVETANGCNVIHDKVKYEIDNIGYHSCFCTYRHPHFNSFLLLYKNYERGVLPFRGSLMDQPAYIMEIFTLIENLKSDREQEEREREERRNKK